LAVLTRHANLKLVQKAGALEHTPGDWPLLRVPNPGANDWELSGSRHVAKAVESTGSIVPSCPAALCAYSVPSRACTEVDGRKKSMGTNQVQSSSSLAHDAVFSAAPIEYYVDADEAAKFLKVNRRTVLRWAREGSIPAHPLTHSERMTWRFKLSELDEWLSSGVAFVSTSRRPCHEGGIQ
jgi:excisionase family DNA binding protein